jgi:regulator of protease activity HflC (stomatin/prohibitin superfamily)
MPDFATIVWWGVGIVLTIFILGTVLSCFFTVHTKQAGVVERLGKFNRIATEGLNWKTPWIERLVYTEELNMQLLDVPVQSKTSDDATISIPVRVQYYVLPDKVKEAYYELDDPELQIKAHVENVILSYIPKITLDDSYKQEDQIAQTIKDKLTTVMAKFGYCIENALVTKIVPSKGVLDAMNDINTARRERIATEARAEMNKNILIKNAEGEAEAKHQAGIGVAKERQAIIDGLKESIESMKEATHVSTEEVMMVVLATQYFDMMKAIGGHSNTIMMQHSPSGINTLLDDIRGTLISSSLAAKEPPPDKISRKAA